MPVPSSSPLSSPLVKHHRPYFSSASLAEVVELTVCRRPEDQTVIGLHFRYEDGSRAVVGQFRLDWTESPLEVAAGSASATHLYLGFDKSYDGANLWVYHVKRAEVKPPTDRGSLKWMDIPWESSLEWWFTSRDCKISHSSRESPPFELANEQGDPVLSDG